MKSTNRTRFCILALMFLGIGCDKGSDSKRTGSGANGGGESIGVKKYSLERLRSMSNEELNQLIERDGYPALTEAEYNQINDQDLKRIGVSRERFELFKENGFALADSRDVWEKYICKGDCVCEDGPKAGQKAPIDKPVCATDSLAAAGHTAARCAEFCQHPKAAFNGRCSATGIECQPPPPPPEPTFPPAPTPAMGCSYKCGDFNENRGRIGKLLNNECPAAVPYCKDQVDCEAPNTIQKGECQGTPPA